MSPYTMSKIEEPMRCAVKFLECIGNRDVVAAGELLDEACVFIDFEEKRLPIKGRSEIGDYFVTLFQSCPQSYIKVSEANNFPHKCLTLFAWSGLNIDQEKPLQCVGIFEVRNALILSINLFCKK